MSSNVNVYVKYSSKGVARPQDRRLPAKRSISCAHNFYPQVFRPKVSTWFMRSVYARPWHLDFVVGRATMRYLGTCTVCRTVPYTTRYMYALLSRPTGPERGRGLHTANKRPEQLSRSWGDLLRLRTPSEYLAVPVPFHTDCYAILDDDSKCMARGVRSTPYCL